MKLKFFTILFFLLTCFTNAQVNTDQQSVVQMPGFYQVSPPNTFSIPHTVNGFDNFYLGVDFGEPHIATNPRDPLNSICAFNINNYYYTLDGYQWTKTQVAFSGFSVLGDPVVAFDSLGNAFYVQLYQNGSTYGVCVNKSTNNGVTWGVPTSAFSTTVGLADKEWIAADQTGGPNRNNLYVCWRQFGASGMRFVRSTNGGSTWSSPLSFGGNQGAYVSVGANGSVSGGLVHFAAIGNATILYNRSTDGGLTFSSQINAAFYTDPGTSCNGRNTVKDCIRMDPFPRMAADNSYTSTRGNVYIAYVSNVVGPDNCDIFLVRSTDGGLNWGTAIRVNDDATTTDQWMPAIWVDKTNGIVYMTWYDSRVDVSGNLQTRLYSAYSTNGGVSFITNSNLSNASHNPNNMRVFQPSGHYYIGDYIGVSSANNVSYSVWMDGRNNNLGSYTGFFPDFAMLHNPATANLGNNDSVTVTVKIPAVNGPFTDRVKFTAALDTLPVSGTITMTFLNGRDSLTTYPDSVYLRIRTIGTVTPRRYGVIITGRGTSNGLPVHKRTVDVFVNSSLVSVGTNREGIADFKVNNVQYNTRQNFVFTNGTNVTVQAISPRTVGLNRYVYLNWSDNGDTTHSITVNSNLTLTANYKIQYRLIVSSSVGNTFGGNDFYDSASATQFGVLSRNFVYMGNPYRFRGWDGSGVGSYTSSDSTGNDSAVTITVLNPIVETARWMQVIGIKNISSEIPKEYKLYQNFPNPFNPVTNINFDIIKKGNVRITIYDITGRVVETLVNETLVPGKFQSSFDASNFASGLYFYKIEAVDFVDVKKMVVIK